jgi:hypothetical protein
VLTQSAYAISPEFATGGNRSQIGSAQKPQNEADFRSFAWEATELGRHSVRARATDAAGNAQPEVPPWNRFGYGNNAIEVIYVDVR